MCSSLFLFVLEHIKCQEASSHFSYLLLLVVIKHKLTEMFLQIHFIFLVEILFTNNICVLCVGKNLSFTDIFSFIVLLITAGRVRQMTLLSTFINQEQTAALMILFSNNSFKIVSDFLVNHQQTPYILIHFSNSLFSLFV